jgi:acyl-CoA thioesterase FadM
MTEEDAPGARHWRRAPAGAFVRALRVRSYEVGRSGLIGVGTLLRYLEALATEASAAIGFDFSWYERHSSAFVVREMELLLGSLPRLGEELRLATWVADWRRVQAQREYVVWRRATGRLVARASARWAYVDRLRGQPLRLQDELSAAFSPLGHRMPARHLALLTSGDLPALQGELALTAREYEADSQQHINNCIYADWLGEGLRRVIQSDVAPAAWRTARPRDYHIEYVRPALPGDEMRVASQLFPRGSRSLTVVQTIAGAGDGGLCVRARSRHLLRPA